MNGQSKVEWSGTVLAIQPRTKVWRYVTDNRTHSHIGYNVFLDGEVDGIKALFAIAISEKQQDSTGFRNGDKVTGTAWTKLYPEREYADYYRSGALKRIEPNDEAVDENNAPPWLGSPPSMETYAWRGARVLSKSCWRGKCFRCKWAAMANVIIEYDWNISWKYRFESFCYGLKSCKLYKRGKAPMVPYKDRGSFPDDGWLDEVTTENRGWDD